MKVAIEGVKLPEVKPIKCVDCVFYVSGFESRYDKCAYKSKYVGSITKYDYIDLMIDCGEFPNQYGMCKYFEQKPIKQPWWKFWR